MDVEDPQMEATTHHHARPGKERSSKTPARNVSESLKGQGQEGRGRKAVRIRGLSRGQRAFVREKVLGLNDKEAALDPT
jgi:hypothetical protein